MTRQKTDEADDQDQNRTFRTRLVGVWLISNAALAISITSINGFNQTEQMVKDCLPDGDEITITTNRTCITQALSTDSREVQSKQQEYFKYLLWATFGLSAIRFVGVCINQLFATRTSSVQKLTRVVHLLLDHATVWPDVEEELGYPVRWSVLLIDYDYMHVFCTTKMRYTQPGPRGCGLLAV